MYYITFNNVRTTITDIDDIYKIKKPENIKELYLHDNKLTKLDKDKFSNFTQLQRLNLSNNKLTELDKDIFLNLTQLQKLYLTNNYLTELDKNIFVNLTQLQDLRLSNNNLTELDKDIFSNLTQLHTLHLYNNKLTELDKDIFSNLTQLQRLNLSNNNLTELDKELFSNFTLLKFLSLSNNNLTELDKDIFSNLTQLQTLYLHNNNLTELDKNIFSNLTLLQDLRLSHNKLTKLPISIINCRNLTYIFYADNEFNYIPPNIQRFLDNITQHTNKIQIYNDSQNVHNHSIQESIKTSLQNILNIPKNINKDTLINDLIQNNYMNEHSMRLLLEYCQNTSIHSVLNITFEESLLHILEYINQELVEHKKEILKILEMEILDSECKCFTGRISRLINCLNGFSDLVQINIPDNMAISNVIVMIKNNYKGNNLDELKDIITKELLDRGYSEDKINEYIDYVEI
jgi:Leucine-rich repeat (LRR) protein